jgi:RNA polymerase sigma factor (TIGR02999 family)
VADSPADVTTLLHRARDPNDQAAHAQLYPLVEGELRKIAEAYLKRQGPGHLLQASVLIDEAYVRLVLDPAGTWEDRQQFYRIASGVMRRLLIDHARRQRPGLLEENQLAQVPAAGTPPPDDRLQRAERLLALDRALERLREHDVEAAELFELCYFGALRLSLGERSEEWHLHVPDKKQAVEEVAAALGLRRSTAYRILARARKFLRRELQEVRE